MRTKEEWTILFENFKNGITNVEFIITEIEIEQYYYKDRLTEYKKIFTEINNMKVQRYDLGSDSEKGKIIIQLEPTARGDWVEYSDYESLEERVAELESQIETLEAG